MYDIGLLFCVSRDTYLLRTSSRFSAWPWSSSTAWPSGKRTTWRRRRAFFRQEKKRSNISTGVRPVLEEALRRTNPSQISIYAPPWYPYFPPVKRHAICLWRCREALRAGTFSRCRGIPYSFLYAMWPECLTDNLTGEDEELRLHGLCWCSSPPMGFLHPPPSRPSRHFHTPRQRTAAFSNSRAGLPPGVCGSVLCAPSSTLSISTCLPISISSFSSAASFLFLFFAALPSLSLSPSPLRSLLPCTEWLLQASSFLHLCHYRTVKRFVHSHSSRTSRPKTGIRDDSSFSDLLLRISIFSHAFVFNFPPVGDIWKERPGSFDMRALICLNPVPCLTQASRKSAQIGEPELDRGPVNHKGRGGGVQKRRRPCRKRTLQVSACAQVSDMWQCQSDMHSHQKDKINYFYKLFLTSGEDH